MAGSNLSAIKITSYTDIEQRAKYREFQILTCNTKHELDASGVGCSFTVNHAEIDTLADMIYGAMEVL